MESSSINTDNYPCVRQKSICLLEESHILESKALKASVNLETDLRPQIVG